MIRFEIAVRMTDNTTEITIEAGSRGGRISC
jgi:hypothetical protein